MKKRTDLKHAHVPSPSSLASSWQRRSAFASPMDHSPITSPPMAALSPISLSPLRPLTPLSAQFAAHQFSDDKTFRPSPSPLQLSFPPSKKRRSEKLSRSASTKPLLRPSMPEPVASPSQPFYPSRRRSFRTSTGLNLTGRPTSHFKFWTTISADPSRRTSWIESQKQKSRQHAWIAWAAVFGLGLVVAGVVVTLLVLKTNNVI